ncbi:hypothetical protein B9G55_17520 [Saccharibacillus sp. O16]|nr:hypothetical protein B9G55_17520 [Saccharibacillus sp. O16]
MNVDDYLDLYNYAKSIGDAEWQESLTESLVTHLNTPVPTEEAELSALWERFDRINDELKQLFVHMRIHADSARIGEWEEKVWELKLERIIVSQHIRFRGVRA